MLRRSTNPMRAVSQSDVMPDDEVTLATLALRVTVLEDANKKNSSFVRWLVGIIATVGIFVSGLAYNAHSQLADRLIEVTRMTEAQLARIEERLAAQQRLLEHVFETRPEK